MDGPSHEHIVHSHAGPPTDEPLRRERTSVLELPRPPEHVVPTVATGQTVTYVEDPPHIMLPDITPPALCKSDRLIDIQHTTEEVTISLSPFVITAA